MHNVFFAPAVAYIVVLGTLSGYSKGSLYCAPYLCCSIDSIEVFFFVTAKIIFRKYGGSFKGHHSLILQQNMNQPFHDFFTKKFSGSIDEL